VRIARSCGTGYRGCWIRPSVRHGPSRPAVRAGPVAGPVVPAVQLGGLAVATTRGSLGTLVTGFTYPSPVPPAEATTTLYVISRDRPTLGLGASLSVKEHVAYGSVNTPELEQLHRFRGPLETCPSSLRRCGALRVTRAAGERPGGPRGRSSFRGANERRCNHPRTRARNPLMSLHPVNPERSKLERTFYASPRYGRPPTSPRRGAT
jgi:alkanesulfonate monooxygenase SsuD/methylene tetrahydromethanopterin reductase-like flavin-dependent oxidoreductase (luciferase family)